MTMANATYLNRFLLIGGVLAAVTANGGSVLDAVKSGDAARIQAALLEPTDANETDADGTSALHWAVHHELSEWAAKLVAAGANVDAENRYGVRPLYLAAENGDAAMVSMLLEAGADPNGAVPAGETAIMTAARTGDVPTLEALIAGGADVNAAEDRKGQTALMWAAAENNGAAVATLLDAGADRDMRSDSGQFTALTFAVRAGALDAAKVLLDAGADPNDAFSDGLAVDGRVDTDGGLAIDGMGMLGLATINGHYELAALLLDYGADANGHAHGWNALHQIAWTRRWNRGFNLPGPVRTGNLDSLEFARKLVAFGADVNARVQKEPHDGNRNRLKRIGATPFLLAAKSADVELMTTLLELGADPSIPTEEGTTAVMAAAGLGGTRPGEGPGTVEEALASLKLALEAGGGDVNDTNANGDTPLHGAVDRGGALPLIELLVARGAKLDAVNNKGLMPVTAADGIQDGNNLRRYPEAAAYLRAQMRSQGLPVPEPVAVGLRIERDNSGAPE